MTILKNTLISKVRKAFSPRDAYLKKVTGVIHVGANAGQEREIFMQAFTLTSYGLSRSLVFEQLQSNLDNFPKQRAYQYLLSRQDERRIRVSHRQQ